MYSTNIKKKLLLARFNKKSIRDLKNLLDDYLYNLGINLNLRKSSHIDFATSLIDYEPYSNLKTYEIDKEELKTHLISLTTKIDSLLNENKYINGNSENYFSSCPAIINGNIYLSIKVYNSKELINTKLYLLAELNKQIYSINSKFLQPNLRTPFKSKKPKTSYKLYFLDLDRSQEQFNIKKQEKLPTYPFFDSKLQEIEPFLTLGILGAYNEMLSELGENESLNKIPYKPCISLKSNFSKDNEFSSPRWIKPKIYTMKKLIKKNSDKLINSISNLKYSYNSPNYIEDWDWIAIYY